MRKRTSRPRRFAAVDNEAIDTLGSLLAVGLLTRLIRAQDGDDVTVESLARDYDEGESALGKAMRMLVDKALVIKFKIQRQATETIEDADGRQVQKRGGSWWTTFSVDSIPFTQADAAAMLADIFAGGNVRAVRVEPEWLDPRKAATDHPGGGTRRSTRPTRPAPSTPDRPTPQNAGVGPTCENIDSGPSVDNENPENSGSRPTPPKPRAGRPSAGEGGALFKEETVVEDSLCGAAGTRVTSDEPGTRETATEHPSYDTAGTPLGARQSAQEAPEAPEAPTGSSAASKILPSEPATEAATFAAALPGRLGPESVRMLAPPGQISPGGAPESGPLLLPSLSPSSLSGVTPVPPVPEDAPARTEREIDADGDKELPATSGPQLPEPRLEAPTAQSPEATKVLDAYEEALGGPALRGARRQVLADAQELLKARPLWWVIDRARELPRYGKNLARHAEMSRVPFKTKAPSTTPPSADACTLGCDEGWIEQEDGAIPCSCLRTRVSA